LAGLHRPDAHSGLARAAQADLFRDIVRAPCRPLLFRAAWRAPRSPVPQLAETIYDGRCFHELPVLADALEDAGCDCDEILGHLREPGFHVRGCWALDLCLGRW
jgi:hypothetical protein